MRCPWTGNRWSTAPRVRPLRAGRERRPHGREVIDSLRYQPRRRHDAGRRPRSRSMSSRRGGPRRRSGSLCERAGHAGQGKRADRPGPAPGPCRWRRPGRVTGLPLQQETRRGGGKGPVFAAETRHPESRVLLAGDHGAQRTAARFLHHQPGTASTWAVPAARGAASRCEDVRTVIGVHTPTLADSAAVSLRQRVASRGRVPSQPAVRGGLWVDEGPRYSPRGGVRCRRVPSRRGGRECGGARGRPPDYPALGCHGARTALTWHSGLWSAREVGT